MKKVIYFIATIIALVAMVQLYQRQLGAISFTFLSFFFFYLAFKMLSEKKHR